MLTLALLLLASQPAHAQFTLEEQFNGYAATIEEASFEVAAGIQAMEKNLLNCRAGKGNNRSVENRRAALRKATAIFAWNAKNQRPSVAQLFSQGVLETAAEIKRPMSVQQTDIDKGARCDYYSGLLAKANAIQAKAAGQKSLFNKVADVEKKFHGVESPFEPNNRNKIRLDCDAPYQASLHKIQENIRIAKSMMVIFSNEAMEASKELLAEVSQNGENLRGCPGHKPN